MEDYRVLKRVREISSRAAAGLSSWMQRAGVSRARGLRYLLYSILALRVILWLPPGYSPDNSNSYSPVMPIQGSISVLTYAWNPRLDNGFVNASIPAIVNQFPQYILSGLGLGTWAAQVAWLFVFYLVGSILCDAAAPRLFPQLEKYSFGIVLAGIAYQLAPGLVYNLQDSAAYGLPIGFYWGIPLVVYLILKFGLRPRWIQGALVGLASLLFLSPFPTSVVLAPVVAGFLLVVVLLQAHPFGRLRALPRLLGVYGVWIALFNLWWVLPEFLYRSELLSRLSANSPISSIGPDYLANLLILNWSVPTVPPYLTYLGTAFSIAGLGAWSILTVCALLRRDNPPATIPVFVLWLTLWLLIYSYALPLGPYYSYVVHSSVAFYLFRDPIRFVYLFDFLIAILFAVGATWAYDAVTLLLRLQVPHVSAAVRAPPSRRRRVYSSRRVGDVAFAVACAAILGMAGWPLISGEVVTNTEYNGVSLLPATPPTHGVQIPTYYYQARNWLEENQPGTTKLILPMPDTWLSGESGTTWGYEGGSTIYQDLLPGPLLMNDEGPLGILEDEALQDTYTMAASGGAPANQTPIPMNSVDPLWPGYVGDTLAFVNGSGPGAMPEIDWGVNASLSWGSNGHQFSLSIPHPGSTTGYLGMDIKTSIPGTFEVTWGDRNGTEVGWYSITTTSTNSTSMWIPVSVPPVLNYNASSLNVSAFPTADELVFQYHAEQPTPQEYGSVLISNLSAYSASPEAFVDYAASLGARLIVTDSSILANSSDPLQEYSRLGPIISALSSSRLASFGRVTVFGVPNPTPLLSCTTSWTNASSYWTAFSRPTNQVPFFLTDAPSWLRPNTLGCDLSDVETGADEYSATIDSNGTALVALLQNFDPNWVLSVDGHQVGSRVTVNGFANGWVLNLTGSHRIQVTFLPEEVLGATAVVSIVVGGALVIVAVVRPSTKRFRSALDSAAKKLTRR
jgi:hypothetical protein